MVMGRPVRSCLVARTGWYVVSSVRPVGRTPRHQFRSLPAQRAQTESEADRREAEAPWHKFVAS